MARPTVSVVMPLYNGEAYVLDAILSVQRQTCDAWELVVVDDGSTDGSAALVEREAARDQRIRLIRQENSGGPARPRNRAIAGSQGTYVCFLDPDDLFDPAKLELQAHVLDTHPEAGVVFSDIEVFSGDGPGSGHSYLGRADWHAQAGPYLEPLGGDLFRCGDGFYQFMSTTITSLTTQSVMVRRRALDRFPGPFDEGLVIGQDIDLWFRLALHEDLFFLDRCLAHYRIHESNRTGNSESALRGFVEAHTQNLERAHPVLDEEALEVMRGRIARNSFALGYHYVKEGRFAEGRRRYVAAMPGVGMGKVASAYLKSWIRQALSLARPRRGRAS
jgi:glycosyltransferase involved in cell wall biosynthesis